jgi:hypothetical protein
MSHFGLAVVGGETLAGSKSLSEIVSLAWFLQVETRERREQANHLIWRKGSDEKIHVDEGVT